MMAAQSYRALEEENAALRLLLESAHTFATHAWSCSTVLKTSNKCDCWFGESAEHLTKGSFADAFSSLGEVECKACGHKTDMHLAHISGQAEPACCSVDCSCLRFVLKTQPLPLI